MNKESLLADIPERLQNSATDTYAQMAEDAYQRGDFELAERAKKWLTDLVASRQKILDSGGDLDYAMGRRKENDTP